MHKLLIYVFVCAVCSASVAKDGSPHFVIGPVDDTGTIHLHSRDSRQQLVVTALVDEAPVDVTRDVAFQVAPTGILKVDETGLVIPIADGTATVTATHNDHVAMTKVTVSGVATPPAINFPNQVVPIFTRLGCNGGGCHGKSGGQNGFRLSLLGFYPNEDYEFLRKESRGRRIFPGDPARSLLLTKATGTVPHGGGKRMERAGYEHRVLVQWIQQGMPYGRNDAPRVASIRCYPATRILPKRAEQQIAVIATYTDGSTEDVTRMALFEANDTEMAECSKTGLMRTLDFAGEVAIMARFQGQVATFRATIPLGATTPDLPAPRNFVDRTVFDKLKLLGIPPSPPADDATFLRRVYLDITGTIPNEQQVTAFLRDGRDDKRDRLIDELLAGTAYADHFAKKWNFVLRNKKSRDEDKAGMHLFHQWIWDSIYENKRYDQFVREIITASGEPLVNPAVTWFRDVDTVEEQVEDTAQLFLGVRIQCARCHHHPFEKWSQNDYYSLAAFYSRLSRKPLSGVDGRVRDRRVYHNEGIATARNPRSGANLKPAGLGADELNILPTNDPRLELAAWMVDSANPFFARSLVNRYWKHFFHRGIVEPEDDMRATNPPSNPELLDALAARFVESGYDLKDLIRTICRSRTYQLSSLPNDFNAQDKQNFSRYYPRRLSAEALYDAFHKVTMTSEKFSGMPEGTTSAQLVDATAGPYFLRVFGMPEGDTACECERSQDANLAQSLHLLNSKEVQDKVSKDGARAATLAADSSRSHHDRIQELYHVIYCRHPSPGEMKIAEHYITSREDSVRTAYEDLLWALINTKEFLFNH